VSQSRALSGLNQSPGKLCLREEQIARVGSGDEEKTRTDKDKKLRKEFYMKQTARIIAFVATTLATAALGGPSATPGNILGVAGQVNGSVTVSSVSPGGCPTLICTTNEVTISRCFTNLYWKLECTTNAAGQVQCTNVLVPVTRCFTNTFPEITCTNEILAPTSDLVYEQLTGALTAIAPCDELVGRFPSNAVFEAVLHLNLRTNDWAGTQDGSFKIVAGTNVLAFGTMNGVAGVRTPLPDGPCAQCNHFEGTLHGLVLPGGPLPGARIQAAYAGDLTGVTCPSADVPQGAVSMVIDGVAVTPCLPEFHFGDPVPGPGPFPGF
jgi:hypothetical protein